MISKNAISTLRQKRLRILYLIFLFMMPTSNYIWAANTTMQEAISRLSADDCLTREAGAKGLIESADIDTTIAINILIKSLTDEINKPFVGHTASGSYLPAHEHLLTNYCSALKKLLVENTQMLQNLIDSSAGQLKDRLMIIAFSLGDTSKHAKVLNMFSGSSNNYLRLAAIRALFDYGDIADIPIFKATLSDTFSILYKGDMTPREGELMYPIRQIAAGSLGKLGFTIRRNGKEYIIVREPEK